MFKTVATTIDDIAIMTTTTFSDVFEQLEEQLLRSDLHFTKFLVSANFIEYVRAFNKVSKFFFAVFTYTCFRLSQVLFWIVWFENVLFIWYKLVQIYGIM